MYYRMIAAAAFVFATPVAAQEMRPILTAESAKTIVSECEAMATKEGWRVNIAVLDDGRNLKAFLRMDGAFLGSIEVAQWKANGSASFGRATKAFSDAVTDAPRIGFAPNITPIEGGLPIFTKDGVLLGGVGVSGTAAPDDAKCAKAGIEKAGFVSSKPEAD